MKRILLLGLMLIWLLPGAALAHSTLETAEPGVGSTVDASPDSIQLSFNTDIEKISNFKLFNEQGEQVGLGQTNVEGPTMAADVPSALSNGVYTVKWTIVGADGHAVPGEYTFTVNAPAATETPAPAATDAPTGTADAEATDAPTSEPEASPSTSPSAAPDVDETSGDGSDTNYAPFMIIGSVIVVAAALIAVLRRRKS